MFSKMELLFTFWWSAAHRQSCFSIFSKQSFTSTGKSPELTKITPSCVSESQKSPTSNQGEWKAGGLRSTTEGLQQEDVGRKQTRGVFHNFQHQSQSCLSFTFWQNKPDIGKLNESALTGVCNTFQHETVYLLEVFLGVSKMSRYPWSGFIWFHIYSHVFTCFYQVHLFFQLSIFKCQSIPLSLDVLVHTGT